MCYTKNKNKENLRVAQACGRACRSWRPPLGGPSHHTVNTPKVILVVSKAIEDMDMCHIEYSFRHNVYIFGSGLSAYPKPFIPNLSWWALRKNAGLTAEATPWVERPP